MFVVDGVPVVELHLSQWEVETLPRVDIRILLLRIQKRTDRHWGLDSRHGC